MIKKIQIRPPEGGYVDVLHPETDSDMVLVGNDVLTNVLGGVPVQSPTPPEGIIEGRLWLDTSEESLQETELTKIKDVVTGAKFVWKVDNGLVYLEEVL